MLAHKLDKLDGQMATLKFYQNSQIAKTSLISIHNLQPYINICFAYLYLILTIFYYHSKAKCSICYTLIKGYDDLLKVLAKILATEHEFFNVSSANANQFWTVLMNNV